MLFLWYKLTIKMKFVPHNSLWLGRALCNSLPLRSQQSGKRRMHLKSSTGPINVLVLSQDEGLETTVPMPKYPRTGTQHTHARQLDTDMQQNEMQVIPDELSRGSAIESQLIMDKTPGGDVHTSKGTEQSQTETSQSSSGVAETGGDRLVQPGGSESNMDVNGEGSDKRNSLASIVERLHKDTEDRGNDEEQGSGKLSTR